MYEIYLITNLINNKKYVGQTNQGYLHRFKEHLSESFRNTKHICLLHKAIKKYGIENFKVDLLVSNVSEEDVDNLESYYIDKYNTYYKYNTGYNMTTGGQGVHNYRHTEDTKKKMSLSIKKSWDNIKKDTEKYKKICSDRSVSHKGKPKSIEHRKHLSEWAKSRTGSKNAFYGKTHSEETKQKISEANGIKVGMFDIHTQELIKEFNSASAACNYLIKEGKTKNKSATSRILLICKSRGKTAYGYIWKFL